MSIEGDRELSGYMKSHSMEVGQDCLSEQDRHPEQDCHPERSEGSKTLHFVQSDIKNGLPVFHTIYRPCHLFLLRIVIKGHQFYEHFEQYCDFNHSRAHHIYTDMFYIEIYQSLHTGRCPT